MPSLGVYNAIGHYMVEGWVEPPILQVVVALSREQARQGVEGAVAEIGVHHGRFFISLLLTDPEGATVAVDVFDDQALNQDGMGKATRRVFERNLRRHADGAAAPQIWARDSTTLSGHDFRTSVGPVRLFSVDGGHSREVVAHDMRTAADALPAGGIVIADDVSTSAGRVSSKELSTSWTAPTTSSRS
jgi:Methyltransferase domain